MNRRRLEKRVGAYRDGALPGRAAEALRRQLESDPDARLELARHEALGRLTREAWSEGPVSPSPEMLIAALRPAMTRIDRELERTQPARWRGWLAPVPIAALGTVAAALAVALLRPASLPPAPTRPPAAQIVALAPGAPSPTAAEPLAASSEPADQLSVYDLAPGDSPLLVFEDGGTTFIWLIEPERAEDDLSSLPIMRGGWV